MDAVSARNLELVDPLFAGEGMQTTLFWTMDCCMTPMGKRLLRATLLRPSREVREVEARLDAVAEAATNLRGREQLRRLLGGVLDLERLLSRVALDSAGPREVAALGTTLAKLPEIRGGAGGVCRRAVGWVAQWFGYAGRCGGAGASDAG